MKFHYKILMIISIISCSCNMMIAQNERGTKKTKAADHKSVIVVFKCEDCKIKNKFSVLGAQNFTLKKVKFPLKRTLVPGTYKMTYWQNRVQQIHLPFTVKLGETNYIKVK